MKITFVYWSLRPVGGVERMMATMMETFVKAGEEVAFVHIRPPTNPTLLARLPEVPVVHLNATNIVTTIVRLARFFRNNRPDVAYSAMPTTNITMLLARLLSFRRFPVVISERSDPAGEARMGHSWRYKAAIRLTRYAYPFADHVVCVSQGLANHVAKVARIKPERLSVIYNPVVGSKPTAPPPEPPHPWLQERQDCPVVLTAGRLAEEKDFATLIDAFAILRKNGPARLIILGEGDQRPDLQSRIDAHGLTQDAILPGGVPDISPWLHYADVFVVSSLYEGFGNALVEAMAVGCQVVSTDCPFGPREILRAGVYGKLVPVADAPAMARAITETLQNPIDRDELKRRSLDFTVSASMQAYDTLFKRLSGSQSGRSEDARFPEQ